ncbi:hypothetical protein KQI84_12535 [bacterium]|nr:hypothetical protein [bacterium]
MAIRSARESFSKDDVIEILRRNVTLYKNEPEFVEYIVNLALYLIDQAYCLGGERSSDLESVLEHFEIIRERRGADDDELIEDVGESPTRKLLSEMIEPVMKAPPPPMEEEEMDMTTDQLRALELQRLRHEQSPKEKRAQKEDRDAGYAEPDTERLAAQDFEDLGEDDEPRTKRLFSPGALTPIPEGGLGGKHASTEKPKIEVNQKGQTRVYRVVRSYSATDGDTLVCPICGTDTKGDRRCPSCGHIM